MANVFGNCIKLSIFGESHSDAIGVVLDGLPAGLPLDMDAVLAEMARRAPGQNRFSTPRKEADAPKIVSGLFQGKTTGTPLCALIENTNTRSKDYQPELLRPAHADYTAFMRYHGFSDYRGGGHFSGRLTAPLVFAGAVLKPYLAAQGIEIFAHIKSLGKEKDAVFNTISPDIEAYRNIQNRELALLDENLIPSFAKVIDNAKENSDSVGGVIEALITGVPAGLGSPFFESVESRLSAMLFSVPAVKGVEFGTGFGITELFGSQANDAFCLEKGEIKTKTNHNGGINGGITNGMPLSFSVAVKPTPSIAKPQQTVNIETQTEETIAIHGRHDPCIVPRAVCVIEAAATIVMADLLLEAKTYAEPATERN
ncbi:MAG: chorismate synthase [Ruminococcaceae bacterium]|nr:chorismate synthase [Oscillospiraceae bacterium]